MLSRTSVLRASSVSFGLLISSIAWAQTTFPEVEPNDNKGLANAFTMTCGDLITGNSTGASTTTQGPASADTFRIKTISTGTPRLFTLTISHASGSLPPHTLTVRGLNQSGGVPGTTDSTVQTAQTVGSVKVSRWYGTGPVGAEQEIYVRVAGTASSVEDYTLTLTCDNVTPTPISGTVNPGSVTVRPDAATDTAIDTDFWVFDNTYAAIPDFGHDDVDGTGVTRFLNESTYYVAFGNYNTCTNLGSPSDDTFRTGLVLDFPNVLTNATTGSLSTMNCVVTDGASVQTGFGGRSDSFMVVWYSFVVSPPLVPQGSGAANPSSAQITTDTLLTVTTIGAVNPPSSGITVRGDLSGIHGSSNQIFYDDGTHGDASAGDNVFSFLATLAEPLSAGPIALPFTVADAQGRSSTGNINFTLTAAPTGACCTAGACTTNTAYNCGQGGGTYQGNATDCGLPSYQFTNSSSTFESIAGSGINLTGLSSCDDCTQQVSLPFGFTFFGNTYGAAFVSTNGNIQFTTTGSAVWTNTAIPATAAPNAAIYPMWDDYNPLEQGDVYMQELGTAPNRRVVFEWNNVTQYTAASAYPLTNENFQVVLHEGSNNIEFIYGSITPTIMGGAGQGAGVDSSGGDRTIGVENSTGTIAFSTPSASFTGQNMMVAYVLPPGPCTPTCGTSDFNGDGDFGTDADIEAFFACLAGSCCPTCWHLGQDFNGDGDIGTDGDIESFFRVLANNPC